ncbi:MAG: Lrp/AsnC family transcriptional regulator [Thermoplasmata archaeon]|jgi:DNA-binding Lrp family transcriptional regulator
MDPLDLKILRETSRGRVMWWGSLDPRVSIREVGRRLRTDPTTIWNRLRSWQRDGFLLGYSVVPNPTLFGAGLAGGSVRISDSRAKERFFRDFGLIEGAAFAVDQVGPWVVVMFAHQSERGLQRSAGLTRRLPGVAEMEPCIPFHCPETTMTPSRLDWRILETLAANPAEDISRCARTLGITSKTFTRRYNALIRDFAVWSIPQLDFSRYRGATVARFLIWLSPRTVSQSVLASLEQRFPSYILLEDQTGLPDTGSKAVRLLSLFVQLSSAGEVEDADRVIREVDGVMDVETYFPRRLYVYTGWFGERLASHTQPD